MQTESDVTVSAALLLALGLAHFAQEENDSSQAAVSPVLFTSILKNTRTQFKFYFKFKTRTIYGFSSYIKLK